MSGPSDDPSRPRTAIVIGASLTGMLAAHVASRRFERVLLLERGDIPLGLEARRGVPQEQHVHMLLQRGKQELEALFPGFIAELERWGAEVVDASRDARWFHRGRWKRRFTTGSYSHFCSRGLLDHIVRERVRENPRVEFHPTVRVTGLASDGERRVTGVTVQRPEGEVILRGDLVIDASGRGSQSERWMKELGGEPVRTSELVARLGYASRIYERRPEYAAAWKVMLILPKPPETRRLGVLCPIEGNRWLLTTGGWLDEYPEDGEEGLLEFLRSLPSPALYEVIQGARPLTAISSYRMPGSLRRHFEEVERWPAGFVVMGDAMCSLNPIYGQGMTVSAMQAQVLAARLEALVQAKVSATATRALQRELAEQARVPWEMVQAEDLRFSEIAGPRSLALKVQQKVGAMVTDAAAIDPVVCRKWLDVLNLMAPPEQLLRPLLQARVLAAMARLRLLRAPEEPATDRATERAPAPAPVAAPERARWARGTKRPAAPEMNEQRRAEAGEERTERGDQRAHTEPGAERAERADRRARTEPGADMS